MSEVINGIQVIEVRGIRALTTKQIAKAYGVEEWRIKQNFSNNRARYIEGKHFIVISGKELKEFKERVGNSNSVKRTGAENFYPVKGARAENFYPACDGSCIVGKTANKLYLWTERGALLHAKSLNTDQAWEVYDRLVDFYFRAKERQQDKPKEKKSAVAPVQQTVPVQKAHPMKILVTDVPDNAKVQEVLKKLRKDIAGIDAVIDQFNRYITKEDYERLGRVADLMAMGLYKDTLRLADIKPNEVEKAL